MKLRLILCMVGVSCLCQSVAHGQGVAVSARLGSLGAGAEIVKSITPVLNTRIGANLYDIGFDGIEGEDLRYDLKAHLRTITLFLDWYPFDKAFHLSAGVFYNKNNMKINLESASSIRIGATTYSPEELGKVDGKVEFNTLAPYLGIGFGNAIDEGRKLSFSLDLGVMYQASPALTLIGTGAISPTAEQQPLIEDNMSWAEWYPNLCIGLSWKF